MTLPDDALARKAAIGRPRIVLDGVRIGRRTVVGHAGMRGSKSLYRVRCDCGHEYNALRRTLKMSDGCQRCAHKGERPYRRKRPFEAQYNNFVTRARYPVDITYEQYAVLAEEPACHYCAAPISWRKHRGSLTDADAGSGAGSNLDRKDHTKHYTLDNVVVCCRRCNIAKNVLFSYEEWKQIGVVINSFQGERNG